MKVAELEKLYGDNLRWRYLRRGVTKHALESQMKVSVCGNEPLWFDGEDWLGTGSQREYNRCDALRECKRCTFLLGAKKRPSKAKHVRNELRRDNPMKFSCEFCPAEYTTDVNLRAHQTKQHPVAALTKHATINDLLVELSRRGDKLKDEHLKADADHLLTCLDSDVLNSKG